MPTKRTYRPPVYQESSNSLSFEEDFCTFLKTEMKKGAFHSTSRTDSISEVQVPPHLSHDKMPDRFKIFKYLSLYFEKDFSKEDHLVVEVLLLGYVPYLSNKNISKFSAFIDFDLNTKTTSMELDFPSDMKHADRELFKKEILMNFVDSSKKEIRRHAKKGGGNGKQFGYVFQTTKNYQNVTTLYSNLEDISGYLIPEEIIKNKILQKKKIGASKRLNDVPEKHYFKLVKYYNTKKNK